MKNFTAGVIVSLALVAVFFFFLPVSSETYTTDNGNTIVVIELEM